MVLAHLGAQRAGAVLPTPLSEFVHPGPPHTSVTCDFLSSEKATDGSLQSEDWALNMEICDIINETEEG